MDSIDFLEILLAVEATMNIEIKFPEAKEMKTKKDLKEIVIKKLIKVY